MSANVTTELTPQRRRRGRAAIALLPGVFALMLAGATGAAAGTATPSPTPRCHHGSPPDGPCCPRKNQRTTSTTNPTACRAWSGGSQGNGNGGSTSTATPAPTRTPAPTPQPVTAPGGSAGSHTGGGTPSGGTSAARTQAPVDPTPFAPLASAVTVVTTGQSLDAARIPPVEALTPLSGLEFGNGLNVGPILLLIDLIGIGLLCYLVRTRWLAHED